MKLIINNILCALLAVSGVAHAQNLTLEQVLQRVVDHYPSLKTAAIQVERARQGSLTVESQLGWQVGAEGGFTRDTGITGTPVDVIDVGGSLSRNLESGSNISLQASISREDSESVLSPALPDPSTSTSIDLRFRQPLAKGSDNPLYTEGLASAEAEVVISRAEQEALYDQLATQIIDIYMAASNTQARMKNSQYSIQRAERLRKYIKDRANLGVSEDKDILQANAQIKSQQAELRSLQTLWQQQRISLNRLMGRPWTAEIETEYTKDVTIDQRDFDLLFEQAKLHDAELSAIDGRLQLADSAIRSRRDARENNLDLVLFVGSRTQQGDTAGGEFSESDIVGGVRLEFSQDLDKSGVDAELYQAQLERSAAIQDKRQLLEDLQYELASLLAEIEANALAIDAYQASVVSEKSKMDDALERYRTGRTDTDQLISFEDQKSLAELSLELQRIELARRYYNLMLMTGTLWSGINLPEYSDYLTRDTEENK